ncbi:hypothetical protein HFP89_06270 [Wenzhouxiangella sp. XN79A]|uniref:winged helix-turn-helix domain-containing protein n=1 Tax=Wenzhouxiangella sp. XN79A TaxID=2724193 RepID=UPI00144ADCC7|nr:winged helix-turn-helix domain-containing protein [Wenzhouxiangella sp. XN79A]NKI34767.1 hypothetical protein [Wenzhouxiangella sp. XN79A]
MSSSNGNHGAVHRFGGWRFDPATGDLDDGRAVVRLEPQVARLLAFFLTHQHILVGRDDLIREVWDGRIVSDHAINRCVSILRSRLTPQDRNAFIETVVRRGFIAHFPAPAAAAPVDPVAEPSRHEETVSGVVATEPKPLRSSPPGRSRTWRQYALFGALVMTLFAVLYRSDRPASTSEPLAGRGLPMLAVLPFASNDRGAESVFLAAGIHDDLLMQLAQFESLGVISRTSVQEYADREMNLRQIGRELGADAILEGGVQRFDDRIRINVQLIDARSDTHLWAGQYERELTPANIFQVQSDIARAVANALHAELMRDAVDALDVIPTDNMAAYRAFHEAMQRRKTVTIADPEYVSALKRAVELDPGFVRAWAELAGSLSFLNLRVRDGDQLRRLDSILERIHELAPESSELLVAQMYYTYYVLKDYPRALQLVDLILERRPSDLQALEVRTWIQRRLGDLDGVTETLIRAGALDPRSDTWDTRLAWNLLLVHRYDRAVEVLERTPHESQTLALLSALLRANAVGDTSRLADDVAAIEGEFGRLPPPVIQWESLMAARAFPQARALLDRPLGRSWGLIGTPDRTIGRLLVDWAEHGQGGSDGLKFRANAWLQETGHEEFGGFEPTYMLARALVHAVAGQRSETERYVRAWSRGAPRDQAELINQRHNACRALGMAGAAREAIACLRDALGSPSWVLPAIEPGLP